ncbi:MAG: allophanate hydrolase [Kiritimatiellia bacterium]|jgi:allophanate hydrolase
MCRNTWAAARRLCSVNWGVTADETSIRVAVCGAHMRDLPLHHQLTDRGGHYLGEARTAPAYRFVALPGEPAKPGLIRVPAEGASIALELWSVSAEAFGELVALIPPPRAMGSLELDNGTVVKGFVCEGCAGDGAIDISQHGSWRRDLES